MLVGINSRGWILTGAEVSNSSISAIEVCLISKSVISSKSLVSYMDERFRELLMVV